MCGPLIIILDRLQANDRVDPYVAVYEAPEPSTIGTVSHVRWRGGVLPHDLIHTVMVGQFSKSVFVPFVCPALIRCVDFSDDEGSKSSMTTFVALTASTLRFPDTGSKQTSCWSAILAFSSGSTTEPPAVGWVVAKA